VILGTSALARVRVSGFANEAGVSLPTADDAARRDGGFICTDCGYEECVKDPQNVP
jgi:hypothetical protein